MKYVKKAKKVTEIADPITATSRGAGMMFKHCFGKTAVITAECLLLLGFSVADGMTCNPSLIAAGAQFGKKT